MVRGGEWKRHGGLPGTVVIPKLSGGPLHGLLSPPVFKGKGYTGTLGNGIMVTRQSED